MQCFISFFIVCLIFKSNSKDSSTSSKHEDIFIDAKTDSYQTIEELEKASDLIVIGTKIKELESNVLYDENGVYHLRYGNLNSVFSFRNVPFFGHFPKTLIN